MNARIAVLVTLAAGLLVASFWAPAHGARLGWEWLAASVVAWVAMVAAAHTARPA